MVGAENPSLVEDVSQPITNYFMSTLATSMNVNNVYRASYFVTNGAANGLLLLRVPGREIIKLEFSGAGTFGGGEGEEFAVRRLLL